jgi:hypothetical protein
MKAAIGTIVAVALSSAVAVASGSSARIIGDYVEVRTAEVFTGGCIMGSEGETSGREAIMAWRVARGSANGVPLDGLSVVAVVAGDMNLGTHELGGAAPRSIRTVLMVDDRATPAQAAALVAMTKGLSGGLVENTIAVTRVPVTFRRDAESVQVAAGAATLDVATNVRHSPACGAIQWFSPLSRLEDKPGIGLTRSQAWTGDALGAQWRQVDRRSSFFGTFSY